MRESFELLASLEWISQWLYLVEEIRKMKLINFGKVSLIYVLSSRRNKSSNLENWCQEVIWHIPPAIQWRIDIKIERVICIQIFQMFCWKHYFITWDCLPTRNRVLMSFMGDFRILSRVLSVWKVSTFSYVGWVCMIVLVNAVLNTTFADSDWRFNNLCSSHVRSQNIWVHHVSLMVINSGYVIDLIGQLVGYEETHQWHLLRVFIANNTTA